MKTLLLILLFSFTLYSYSQNMGDTYFFTNPLESSEKLVITGNKIRNVKVYSVLGKMIVNENYNPIDTVRLNLKNLNPGLYLIKINNQQTSKLIVN